MRNKIMESEQQIWEYYYNIFLDIKKGLDIEMSGFMIDSLQLINIISPYFECIIKNGKIIKEEIYIKEITFIGKEIYIPYIKIIHELSLSKEINEIEGGLKSFIKKLQEYIKKSKIENLFSELSDSIEGITKEEVIKYYKENIDIGYHEISTLIIKEQELKNMEPDIDEQSFFEKYPEFETLVDKDGLTNISLLECNISTYGIYYEDYFLYFDKQIREISSGYYFFYEFFTAKKQCSDEADFKLSLDFDKIISRNKYRQLNRLGGFHYGPDFKLENFFTNSDKTLFTRKIRLNPKFDEYTGYKIFASEFYIDQRDNSFLIEEIGEREYQEDFLNRLIHSKFDIKHNNISHFDGSILFYDKYSLEERKKITLEKRPKLSKRKKKLFRVDGKLGFEEFKNILFAFYLGNEMILEYFDIEEYKKQYKDILDYKNGIDY